MLPLQNENVPLLIAEDDPDNCLFLQFAFEETGISNPLCFVPDGEEVVGVSQIAL